MKRYLLFAGSTYYPAGGWGDFLGDFDSVEEAQSKAAPSDYDWREIIDTQTMTDVDVPATSS